MAGILGASFVPGADQAAGGRPAAGEPVSRAIKFLSLHLPRVMGAQAMSPGALMQPHQTAYQGADPVVAAAIQRALGVAGGTSAPSSSAPASQPQTPPMGGGRPGLGGMPPAMPSNGMSTPPGSWSEPAAPSMPPAWPAPAPQPAPPPMVTPPTVRPGDQFEDPWGTEDPAAMTGQDRGFLLGRFRPISSRRGF
jgi:hypothetical protein